MKKTLLTLMLLVISGIAAMAAEVTYTPTAYSSSKFTVEADPAAAPYIMELTAAQNAGSNTPTYNTNGHDARLYAKNTVTVKSNTTMTRIVFNLSAQGKKRLAPITASEGTIATQASGDVTVTWTGSATEVTFTVGDKANFGSDGSSKAGQFCFSAYVVTFDDSVSAEPQDFTCDAFKDYNMHVGDTQALELPGNAPEVTYATSDANVAAVENGTLTAVGVGTATITATWAAVENTWNAGSKEFTVTVAEKPDGYVIVFKSNGSDSGTALTETSYSDQIESGAEYISGVSSTANVYGGKDGLKFSSSKKEGKITFTLATPVNCKEIVVNGIQYGSDESSLSVNSSSAQSFTNAFADYTYSINDEISTITLSATKRLYVKSITIVLAKPEFTQALSFVKSAGDPEAGTVSLKYNLTVSGTNAEPEFTLVVTDLEGNVVEGVTIENIPDATPAAAPAMRAIASKTYEGTIVATSDAFKSTGVNYNFDLTAKVGDITSNSVEAVATAVDDILVETAAEAVYYDLTGRVAENPACGLYIRVAGGKATKVYVR